MTLFVIGAWTVAVAVTAVTVQETGVSQGFAQSQLHRALGVATVEVVFVTPIPTVILKVALPPDRDTVAIRTLEVGRPTSYHIKS